MKNGWSKVEPAPVSDSGGVVRSGSGALPGDVDVAAAPLLSQAARMRTAIPASVTANGFDFRIYTHPAM